jgi:hypothetical protein
MVYKMKVLAPNKTHCNNTGSYYRLRSTPICICSNVEDGYGVAEDDVDEGGTFHERVDPVESKPSLLKEELL